jgi:hypothetical protein
LDATKVYSATGIIGRVSFSYNGGGNKDTDVDTSAETAATDTDSLDDKMKQPRLTGPGAKASRAAAAPKMDTATTGRAKRKPGR